MAKSAKTEGDLLAQIGDNVDLLSQIDVDDAEAWVPQREGDGIQGTVYKVGTTRSEFHQGADAMRPTVWLKTRDGDKYRVIAYRTGLKNEFDAQNPQPGDLIAIKYLGQTTVLSGQYAGRPFHRYGVIVQKPNN